MTAAAVPWPDRDDPSPAGSLGRFLAARALAYESLPGPLTAAEHDAMRGLFAAVHLLAGLAFASEGLAGRTAQVITGAVIDGDTMSELLHEHAGRLGLLAANVPQ